MTSPREKAGLTDKLGYRTHAMHQDPPKATNEAREILASAFEGVFPDEAERARKGLHFMLPSSWALEAIQIALDRRALSDAQEKR